MLARPHLVVAIVLALIGAACSFPYADPPASSTTTTTVPGTTTTTEPPATTQPEPVDPSDVLGPADRVLIQGPAGVTLADAAGFHDLDRAGAPFEGQMVFSPDGNRVAWVQAAGAQGAIAVVELFGYNPGAPLPEPRSSATPFVPFYLGYGPFGARLAVLGDVGGPIGLTIADHGFEAAPFVGGLLRSDVPVFPSWGPDGDLAANVGGRIEVLRDGDSVDLGETFGTAPVWLADGRVVFLDPLGELVAVELGTGLAEVDRTSLTTVLGDVRLHAAPDGESIAVVVEGNPAAGGASPVVFRQTDPDPADPDAEPEGLTDGVWLVAPDADPVQLRELPVEGLQWSPVGDRLLLLDEVDDGLLAWSVIDLAGTVVDEMPPFEPTATFAQAYVPFLDQYAQSMSLWSPDGSRFLSPESFGGVPHVVIHAIGLGEQRTVLAPGEMAVWSPLPR